LLVKEEEAEWQQLHLGREVVADDEGAQVQHAPRAPDSSTGPPGAAAEAEAECQAPHQPPPCEPALSLSEGWNASQAPHHPPLCEPALSLSEGWSASQAGAANCLTPGAVTAANTAHATELLASAAGPMGQQHDFSIAEAAAWEHSQDGWQQLVRRAWRGDVQAVLACAQELIHGGDFCLQDFDLARQLLQTVSVALPPGWHLSAVLSECTMHCVSVAVCSPSGRLYRLWRREADRVPACLTSTDD
jgi:hypothetical protein